MIRKNRKNFSRFAREIFEKLYKIYNSNPGDNQSGKDVWILNEKPKIKHGDETHIGIKTNNTEVKLYRDIDQYRDKIIPG